MKSAIFLASLALLCGCSSTKKGLFISQDARSYLKSCSDSINMVVETKIVPQFVYDPCFDYQKRYWPNLHNAISLRNIVVEEIHNSKAIEYILNLNDSRLEVTCNRPKDTIGLAYYKIPGIDKSFKYLLLARLKELKK